MLAGVLHRQAEVSLLHLELGLPGNTELHLQHAQRLGLLGDRGILGWIEHHQAKIAATGRTEVSQHIVNGLLGQRHFRWQGVVARYEKPDRHEIGQILQDGLGSRRERVGLARREV